jgi:uncharacterized membrane protein
MTQPQTNRVDRLVEDYLGAVSYACADLPPDRREDLLEDLREHIGAARAVLYQPTEAAIRTILDRLGEPSTIAEEARLTEPTALAGERPQPPAPTPRPGPPTAVLGMVLGFVLVIILIVMVATFMLAPGHP